MKGNISRMIDRRLRTQCIVESLHKGERISRIEAMVLLAIPNLTSIISNLRKKGLTIHSAPVPYVDVLKRINQYAHFQPPNQLPINELVVHEYWLDESYINRVNEICNHKVNEIFGVKNGK